MVAIKDYEFPYCCDCCIAFNESDYGDWCKLTARDVKNKNVKLDNCPLVEIEEHKVGKWIKTILTEVSGGDFKRGFKCSHCNYVIVTNDFNFCPNCGAEMRGNENEENI